MSGALLCHTTASVESAGVTVTVSRIPWPSSRSSLVSLRVTDWAAMPVTVTITVAFTVSLAWAVMTAVPSPTARITP